MFSNFKFTATWSFVIIQKVTNLLRCKLRSRPKDDPTSFGFFTTLKRAFSNQAPFKFTNSSEYVELKPAVDGRGNAKARGVVFGARPKLTSQEICDLLNDYETPGCSKREIAEHYGISTSSVYRLYYENKIELSA